jgi:hypothetical protein
MLWDAIDESQRASTVAAAATEHSENTIAHTTTHNVREFCPYSADSEELEASFSAWWSINQHEAIRVEKIKRMLQTKTSMHVKNINSPILRKASVPVERVQKMDSKRK